MTNFHLSEQGSTLHHEPKVTEYLKTYKLPAPPAVRYGHIRFRSPQEKYHVDLFGQAWLPNSAQGTILFIHGFSEHVGNYGQLIQDFVKHNYSVAALDLRGHGLSDGLRGHADTPEIYAEDIEVFANLVLPNLTPNRPLYIWAHSMGSLITLQLLLRNKLPTKPAAVVLSSALVGFPVLHGTQKILASLAPLMAKVAPSLQIKHGLDPSDICGNSAYLAERAKDPMINVHTTPRWFMSMEEAVNKIQKHSTEFQDLAPTLFLLAGDERITSLQEARKFAFHAYPSLKHKVIEFPGIRHELEKDLVSRPRAISESLAWFQSHA